MVDTLEEAVHPLFQVSFIFGFGILRYPADRTRPRLSIFYMLIVWSIYACAFYYMAIFFVLRQIFGNPIKFIMTGMNWLVTMISIIITVRKNKKFCIYVKKLRLVNDTLEELGIHKDLDKMRNSIKWALIIWVIMLVITLSSDSLWSIDLYRDMKAIFVPIIVDYAVYVNTYIDIMFVFFLRHIGTRLDKINEHIEQLSETEEDGLRCSWKKPIIVTRHYLGRTENRKRVLWAAMHLHSELCRIARDINGLFEIQLTLQMAAYFIALTTMFYFQLYMILCLTYRSAHRHIFFKLIFWTNVWFVIYLIKLISLNHICESVSAKAQKTKCVIHKLSNLIRFSEAREEIWQFVLQISLRPLRFKAMGLFDFGYKFIRRLFAGVLSAIVLMMQVHSSPISRMIIFNNNINVTCDM